MAMPKAAVYEDNRPVLWQHDIRPTRATLVVYPISEPLMPECVTQTKLRTSILGSIVRHTFETLFGCHGNLDCTANLRRIR